ncbi:MAG: GNAT family N-acetyltransferase [Paracoccaceae bacterium]
MKKLLRLEVEYRDIGIVVKNWVEPERPGKIELEGRYVRLVPLALQDHAEPIFRANSADDRIWDYLAYGPFGNFESYQTWVASVEDRHDPVYLAIFDKELGDWAGVASYLRIDAAMGSIEVGNINFSPALQRTRAATEAMYLMMKWAFEAGYRRYEWKCNALNVPSCRAAERLGFSYEGIFRQSMIVKGRNRNTAWFAIIDSEWPALKQAFSSWLSPDNFEDDNRQKVSLRLLTAPTIVRRDPRLA